ncbi:MAG TPA: SPOR domain-containing protein, partial [Candidatus Eisenbacteria bacterium]|nr:SPOR domain-containing protein [Candidatus Eisenbacteria bacterium]
VVFKEQVPAPEAADEAPERPSGELPVIATSREPVRAPAEAQSVPEEVPTNASKRAEPVDLASVPKRELPRPAPVRALEGYVVQVAFNDKIEARRWAEELAGKGHAVSVTVPEGGGMIRLRIGNFSQREDAERHLRELWRQGLSGIVLNLPQAYRPESRPTQAGD